MFEGLSFNDFISQRGISRGGKMIAKVQANGVIVFNTEALLEMDKICKNFNSVDILESTNFEALAFKPILDKSKKLKYKFKSKACKKVIQKFNLHAAGKIELTTHDGMLAFYIASANGSGDD